MRSQFHQQVGVGLRAPHVEYFKNNLPQLSWLEIHSENYFSAHSSSRRDLSTLREHYDISCHGVGLSLGSITPVNQQHLAQLASLVKDIEPCFISDHLSWCEHDGHYFNDLLPLPYTEEALDIFCRNVSQVQNHLRQPILVENPSSYVKFNHSTISEWEFLSEVQRRTGCYLLLDLNNIYVSSFNHGFSCEEYLNGINPEVVKEIHLAGFSKKLTDKGEIWIDTHSKPVCPEVWELFTTWTRSNGTRHTLIEWDLDIPAAEVLLGQAELATRHIEACQSSMREVS